MPVRAPTVSQVLEVAESFGIALPPDEASEYAGLMKGMAAGLTVLDTYPEPKLPVKYPRIPGYRPSAAEDPLNAWYYKTNIEGASSGPLKGKRIGIKDTVAVAGVPLQCGSPLLEGYVPDVDASVVTRILDAGGTIVGKAACTDLCFDGHGQDAPRGGKNPRNPAYGAGGSSCGSAAVLVTGEADITLGGDQAGSIRLPASWCGVYGHKPTHGLVPYTGIMGNDMTFDTIGPMANHVADVALLLSVVAGPDGLDSRQINITTQDYVAALERDVSKLKIGIVREGFGHPKRGILGASDPEVDRKVLAAAKKFNTLGLQVEEVSIPMHTDGLSVWLGIGVEGTTHRMVKLNGMGTNVQGYYDTALGDAYAHARLTRPNDFPTPLKLTIFMGEYLSKYYHGRYYAIAQNLRRTLRQSYDDALAKFDLLLMPTTAMAAQKFATGEGTLAEYFERAWEMLANTCVTSATGHPAMNVPCGMVHDGLPVGMMLIGRRLDDATIISAAHAFEQLGDWTKF
jgi:amidase